MDGPKPIPPLSVPLHWHGNPVHTVHLLFDLDGTLVNVDLHGNTLNKFKSLGPHNLTVNTFKKSTGEDATLLMYLRPGVKEFFANLPDYIDIGIWTSSYYAYATGIVEYIFGSDYKKKLTLFFAGNDIVDSFGIKKKVVYDMFQDKIYESKIINKKVVKNLDILFKHPVYSKTFNPSNTLLVDDSQHHVTGNSRLNRKNVLLLSSWNSNHYCDSNLNELLTWIKTNIKPNSNLRNIQKPKYRTSKARPYIKVDIEDETKKSAIFFNKYCTRKTKKSLLMA